jgi:2-oxoglutarate ferredoxin oxidoreductase subunit delta
MKSRMKNRINNRRNKIKQSMDKLHTEYMWINPYKCDACWACVKACPNQVIGKAGFLWNKHIVIENQENCSGCKKCVKTCPHGVFNTFELKSKRAFCVQPDCEFRRSDANYL